MESDSTGFNFTVGSLRHTSGFLNRRIDFRAELGLIKAALLYADKVQLCSVGASWVQSFDHIAYMKVPEKAALLKELGPELATDLTSKELKYSYHLLDQLQGPEAILHRPRAGTDVKYALEFLDHEWPKLTSYVESVFNSWQVHEYRAALDSDLVEVKPFRSTTPAALCRQGMVDSKEATENFADDAYTEYEETIKSAVSRGETYPLLDDLSGDLVNEAIKNGLAVPPTAHKLSRHGGLSGNLLQWLPMFERASVEEVLEIREHLASYLNDFRVAMDEWASSISSPPWEHKSFRQESKVVYSQQVMQAVEALRRKVEASSSLKARTTRYGLPLLRNLGLPTLGTVVTTPSNIPVISALAAGVAGATSMAIWEGRHQAALERERIEENNVIFYYRAAKELRDIVPRRFQ